MAPLIGALAIWQNTGSGRQIWTVRRNARQLRCSASGMLPIGQCRSKGVTLHPRDDLRDSRDCCANSDVFSRGAPVRPCARLASRWGSALMELSQPARLSSGSSLAGGNSPSPQLGLPNSFLLHSGTLPPAIIILEIRGEIAERQQRNGQHCDERPRYFSLSPHAFESTIAHYFRLRPSAQRRGLFKRLDIGLGRRASKV